jgi:hypothetical protein
MNRLKEQRMRQYTGYLAGVTYGSFRTVKSIYSRTRL